MKKKPKKKKEKVLYIDDGRSLADMSAFGSSLPTYSKGGKKTNYRDAANTFLKTMRMMFLPMLAVIGIISLAFLILYLMLISAA